MTHRTTTVTCRLARAERGLAELAAAQSGLSLNRWTRRTIVREAAAELNRLHGPVGTDANRD